MPSPQGEADCTGRAIDHNRLIELETAKKFRVRASVHAPRSCYASDTLDSISIPFRADVVHERFARSCRNPTEYV